MLKRFAPLVPLALLLVVTGCATTSSTSLQTESNQSLPVHSRSSTAAESIFANVDVDADETSDEVAEQPAHFSSDKSYKLPDLADSILERGFQLVGTPYRFGGLSEKTGFDCSGFVGFLFREEAGIQLPRSTRELINLDAPLVARNDLKPGDIILFNNRGRGRVSHAGIYIGDDQFIHSSSRRSGGVRVDSLDDRYWRSSFMEGKRVLVAQTSLAKSSYRP
ncbi:C40 family peptidase [Pseudomonas kuykendallii]|uniref:Cell wall-associated hydrolase, NlpC family n=1 Tax=Pseudomonas kuykendallii TaxID=1007099 RepID=A0A1H2Z5S5_9PSED|nr:C40 family peptidase [Pseudomonas kuykendallii]MCQ4273478.1 C40 family peptidase [Pseudomonas kuykendallii]SDX12706.1 Cell wall-associated hydrolase, NlpC family [Pseudomonas kuykendallii]